MPGMLCNAARVKQPRTLPLPWAEGGSADQEQIERREAIKRAAAAHLFGDEQMDVSYLASLFTKTSLPYKDPGDIAAWVRRNGPHVMVIQPGITERDGKPVSIGYPYGVMPRLILTWLCTQTVLTKSDTLWLGPSLASFMRDLGLQPTGGRNGSITRMREQAVRLFESTISFRWEGDQQVDRGAKLMISRLWNLDWGPDPVMGGQAALFPLTSDGKSESSFIQLDPLFAEHVRKTPVPLAMEAMIKLRGSAFRMDVYFWLTWRMYSLHHPVTVPWDALKIQFGSTYADTKQGRAEFKKTFVDHLGAVLKVYPQAKVQVTDLGLLLQPSPTSVPIKAKSRLALVVPGQRGK